MAATVLIKEWNGASGSQVATDKTAGTIRFKQADNATVDANNVLPKPPSSVNRSFEKWVRLNFSVAPTGQITNIRLYCNGTFPTGITIYVRTTNPGSYATPATPANDSAGTDFTTYTSGARKQADVANAGPFTGTGDKADYLVLWATVGTTVAAPQNPIAGAIISFTYDET